MLLFAVFSCGGTEMNQIAIVPKPVMLETTGGDFTITAKTKILVENDSSDAAGAGKYLAGMFYRGTGLNLPVGRLTGGISTRDAIVLTTKGADARLGSEGYRLNVTDDSISIVAQEGAGLFYGVQTLLQLLPPQVFSQDHTNKRISWTVPCVQIEDKPRFRWRGLHIDPARHFQKKEDVLRFIDTMVLHKFNVLHFHLTDDQGWRIEIKQYPKLTEVGAWRKEDGFGLDPKALSFFDEKGRYGGFYTQKDIQEIVAYAAARYITVVPEIEMPGHALAALAAFPELSCTVGPFEVACGGGIFKDVYCAGNDQVFEFLDNVLAEVIELFPSKYIHVGGDECPKDRWKNCPKCRQRIKDEGLKDEHELQSWFISRIERFLNSKGKTIIGWDEILEGGLAPNAAVMSWRGMSGGIAAAKAGHDVVMTPTSHCYLDYYQAKGNEPKAIGGFLPIETVYSLEPVPEELTEDQKKHILGVQGNLWSEYIPNLSHLEYMAYPRACALSEVAWTPAEKRDWNDFESRLIHHLTRLSERGVNYRPLSVGEK